MSKSRRDRDPLPDSFASLEEASEFWDTHDLADYWDLTREVDLEVNLERRAFLTALEPELAKKLTARARQEGVSTETLINVWLTEKLLAATGEK